MVSFTYAGVYWTQWSLHILWSQARSQCKMRWCNSVRECMPGSLSETERPNAELGHLLRAAWWQLQDWDLVHAEQASGLLSVQQRGIVDTSLMTHGFPGGKRNGAERSLVQGNSKLSCLSPLQINLEKSVDCANAPVSSATDCQYNSFHEQGFSESGQY